MPVCLPRVVPGFLARAGIQGNLFQVSYCLEKESRAGREESGLVLPREGHTLVVSMMVRNRWSWEPGPGPGFLSCLLSKSRVSEVQLELSSVSDPGIMPQM